MGGGLFSRVEYFKIPRQVEVEICVYFKKLYLREKCIKVKYTSTFNNNCGGARWIDIILFTRLCPLYLIFNPMHIMHTNCIS